MVSNFSIVLKEKIQLLLLCKQYGRNMEFPIVISVGGRVDVLHKYLPSDTSLGIILPDNYGYATAGYVKYSSDSGEKSLFLPHQSFNGGISPGYNYGYQNCFGYTRHWLRGSFFYSGDGSNFPFSMNNGQEEFLAVLEMLNLFFMKVLQDEDDEEEYIKTFLDDSDDLDDLDELAREDVRCNLERAIQIGKGIYRLQNGSITYGSLSNDTQKFIDEYFLFSQDDLVLKNALLNSISEMVVSFDSLYMASNEEYLDKTFFSLLKIEKAGRLIDYFKSNPVDERKQSFESCLCYFNQYKATGDYDFEPLWCRDGYGNLYVCFLSGSNLKETKDFDEMDSGFLCALKEIQFLYEEIFSVIQEIA